MKKVAAAGIYARISSDQSGEGLGVQRQLEDCRKLAADRRWPVFAEYVDNDISGFSGKHRPAYEQMLENITHGEVDAVLVYHLDRLTRRPVELERFIEVCKAADVDVTTVTGDVGLGHDNGLLVARITSAMAAAESGRKSARIKRKLLQSAEMGKPHGGPQRPFGYEPDKVTVRESEAVIIRRLARRYIGGESFLSLARWMNAKGIPTTGSSKAWQANTLRQILTGGRIAGIRDHHGQPLGNAVWPAIISAIDHKKVLAAFAARRRPPSRPRQRSLLRGLLRCGVCGTTLVSGGRQEERRYACSTAPGRDGCGTVSVSAAQIDRWVVNAVPVQLDSWWAIASEPKPHATASKHASRVLELSRANRRLSEIAEIFGAGQIDHAEYIAARAAAHAWRVEALEQIATHDGARTSYKPYDELASWSAQWANASRDRQAAIIRSALSSLTIQPRPIGARQLDVTRMEPSWILPSSDAKP